MGPKLRYRLPALNTHAHTHTHTHKPAQTVSIHSLPFYFVEASRKKLTVCLASRLPRGRHRWAPPITDGATSPRSLLSYCYRPIIYSLITWRMYRTAEHMVFAGMQWQAGRSFSLSGCLYELYACVTVSLWVSAVTRLPKRRRCIEYCCSLL